MEIKMGAFELCILMQKRLREIYRGEKPLVSSKFNEPFDLVAQEIVEEKVKLQLAPSEESAAMGSDEEMEEESEVGGE